MTAELDIVIPVYNEGRNIVATLAALARSVTTPARVLICYDHPDGRHAAGDPQQSATLMAVLPSSSCATRGAAPTAPS